MAAPVHALCTYLLDYKCDIYDQESTLYLPDYMDLMTTNSIVIKVCTSDKLVYYPYTPHR